MGTESELIGVMTYTRSEETGRPAGHISNKTIYIALIYQDCGKQSNVDNFKKTILS